MNNRTICFSVSLCMFFFLCTAAHGQVHTVGLKTNTPASFDGYTLFAPSNYVETYLIDNCGRKVNTWTSEYRAMASYLLENGDLLRVANIPNAFNSGGSAGRIERYNWEGDLLWAYNYSGLAVHQHHDIEPLENGNILLFAWEWHSSTDAIEQGRDSLKISDDGLWSERVVEIKPIGTDSIEEVWVWRVWDHLVQDYDPNRPNYGVVADHPELIDLNFVNTTNSDEDWLHFNSIDYNPDLDQIMLSSRTWSELWVVDHSTTTAEAATHLGGTQNKGGDLLYRWGNPLAYQRGEREDQQLFGQHDPHWVQEGKPDAGKILLFNNGIGRPMGSYSSFDMLIPPLRSDGSYTLANDTMAYGPDGLDWSFDMGFPAGFFFSPTVSGVQQQANGTFLGCSGRNGQFIEADKEGNVVWEYICPVRASGPMQQGDSPSGNTVFKINRYAADYPGLVGKDLTPTTVIELNSVLPTPCLLFSSDTEPLDATRLVYPNPAHDFIFLQNTNTESYALFNSIGQLVCSGMVDGAKGIPVADLEPGLYFLKLADGFVRVVLQ